MKNPLYLLLGPALALGLSSCAKEKAEEPKENTSQRPVVTQDAGGSEPSDKVEIFEETPAEGNLAYPLRSTPDFETIFQPKKAERARKIAKAIITQSDRKGILHYDPNHTAHEGYQGVQAVMVIDDKRYTVWVANKNEDKPSSMRDMLSVWVRKNGSYGSDDLVTFSDDGLDGLCDFGIIPRSKVDTIMFRAKSRYFRREGFSHQTRFQKDYDTALDDLAKFYEVE